jgi:hypothetical protein
MVSFPGYDNARRWAWTGKVRMESIEGVVPGKTTIANVQPFYAWVGQTPSTNGSPAVTAYKNAWWGFDQYVPVTWDGDIQRAVAPYADTWYRDNFWQSGWLTSIQITNNTGSSQTYKPENHLSDGDHGSSLSLCGTINSGVLSIINGSGITLTNGQATTIDAYLDSRYDNEILGNARRALDTSIFISVVGTPLAGNQFAVHVYRNTGAHQACP